MRVACLFSLFLLFFSCVSPRQVRPRWGRGIEKRIGQSPVFAQGFTGFVLLDPATGRVLADVHGDKYFTPASNTKILTLATCLHLLGDSVPALQTQRRILNEAENRSVLLVRGTGDPTFLHPKFQQWQAPFEALKNSPDTLKIFPRKSNLERFGPGWAWDDYPEHYQAERSVFPMYGNVVRLGREPGGYTVEPPFFTKNFLGPLLIERLKRREHESLWALPLPKPGEPPETWLPFTRIDPGELLSDTLGKDVEALSGLEYEYVPDNWQTHYATPLDTVLRRMMHQSDNFIAEQMLVVCAGQKFDLLQQDTVIRWMLDSVLAPLPARPRWVDGSGLSRYNLATPRTLARYCNCSGRSNGRSACSTCFPAAAGTEPSPTGTPEQTDGPGFLPKPAA
ncbi:MAG: D-alanyl-D-alanine carboxypeptidase [Lewinellaceae bacterium]|nr:D-alanyl-D-alanine carboxypeptidase [Lewinellaceae bacterium]